MSSRRASETAPPRTRTLTPISERGPRTAPLPQRRVLQGVEPTTVATCSRGRIFDWSQQAMLRPFRRTDRGLLGVRRAAAAGHARWFARLGRLAGPEPAAALVETPKWRRQRRSASAPATTLRRTALHDATDDVPSPFIERPQVQAPGPLRGVDALRSRLWLSVGRALARDRLPIWFGWPREPRATGL